MLITPMCALKTPIWCLRKDRLSYFHQHFVCVPWTWSSTQLLSLYNFTKACSVCLFLTVPIYWLYMMTGFHGGPVASTKHSSSGMPAKCSRTIHSHSLIPFWLVIFGMHMQTVSRLQALSRASIVLWYLVELVCRCSSRFSALKKSAHFFQTGCAQWNDLILKDTPSFFLLGPCTGKMCLDCGQYLGCVVVVISFWEGQFWNALLLVNMDSVEPFLFSL